MLGVQLGHVIANSLRFYDAPGFDRLMVDDVRVGAVRVQAFARMVVQQLEFKYTVACAVAIQCLYRVTVARRVVAAKLVRSFVRPLVGWVG